MLKTALIKALVLALPDYSKVFIVEVDASKGGIGTILIQDGHPLAFLSKQLSPKKQQLSIYDRKMLAILQAIKKWECYSPKKLSSELISNL